MMVKLAEMFRSVAEMTFVLEGWAEMIHLGLKEERGLYAFNGVLGAH